MARECEILVDRFESRLDRGVGHLLMSLGVYRVQDGGMQPRQSDSGRAIAPGVAIGRRTRERSGFLDAAQIGPVSCSRVEKRILVGECPPGGIQERGPTRLDV